MIQAKSLRIGNWVYYDLKFFDEGTELEPFQIIQIGDSLKTSDGFENYYTEDDLNPIPLTPEILEACGFIKDISSHYGGYLIPAHAGEQIRIVNDETIGWHWPMNGYTRPKVTYLHQLQNFYFSLTGEELIFTPHHPANIM